MKPANLSLASFLGNLCRDLVEIERAFPSAFVIDDIKSTNLFLDLQFLKEGPIFFTDKKNKSDKHLYLYVVQISLLAFF